MPAKEIRFGAEARSAIHRGVTKMASTLAVTLGPRGRSVGLEKKYGGPTVADDGAIIAKEIELEDRLENVGAALLREVSTRTSDEAGDGTTTAAVLAHAIFDEGVKLISAGVNPMAIQRGIEKAVAAVVADLKKQSRSLSGKDGAIHVAAVSANDAEVGRIVGSTVHRVGLDGVVTVEEGKGTETTVEDVEGLRFDKGYLSPYFITDAERMEAVFEDPLILFHEKKISSVVEFLPFLERAVQTGRPIVVISEDMESEALAMLVLNRLRGALRCAAVKAPGFGERRKAMLEDMAVVTGGRLISEDVGINLENVTPEMLGTCSRIVITKEHTTIVGGKGKKPDIQARIAQMKRQIKTTDSTYDREKLSERLAKLSGGVAVIHVGAPTETEMKERKAKIDDAIHATRAALEEGVVPGGGIALLRAASVLSKVEAESDEAIGVRIVEKALAAPIRTIAHNAGLEGRVISEKARHESGSVGFDAETLKFRDLVEAGIIDATKVVRLCIENAASIAGLLLTTEAIVAESPQDEAEPHTPPPY